MDASNYTKWHNAFELVNYEIKRSLEKYNWKNSPIFQFDDNMGTIDISDDVFTFSTRKETIDTFSNICVINDGLKLPFQQFIFEIKIDMQLNGIHRLFILINQTKKNSFHFHFLQYFPNNEGVLPHIVNGEIEYSNDYKMANFLKSHNTWINDITNPVQNIKNDFRSYSLFAEGAIMKLIILLHTKGIERAVIEAPERLNKQRIAKGKTPVPSVTVIKIGHYYDRDGNKHEFTRNSPRVHWRRGHMRNVRFGPGREQKRPKYIFPCLVNYVDGDEKPQQQIRVIKH